MGHADRDGATTGTALAVIGGKRNVIDAAVAVSSSFGAHRGGPSLNHRIRAGVAVARAVDRLVLSHAGHGDRHRLPIRIGHADDRDRDQLMVGRPEHGGIGLGRATDGRLVGPRGTEFGHERIPVPPPGAG